MNWAVRGAVAAALIGGAALGIACSDDGGGTLTLGEYFDELQTLDDRFQDDSERLDSAFESQDLGDIKSAVQAGTDATDDFIDDLNALEPPDEAQEAHDEAVGAGTEFLEALKTFNDAVQDADTTESLGAIPFDAIGAASDRFNGACLDLEAVAAENDIEVDLNCEEPS